MIYICYSNYHHQDLLSESITIDETIFPVVTMNSNLIKRKRLPPYFKINDKKLQKVRRKIVLSYQSNRYGSNPSKIPSKLLWVISNGW
jgi:predicted metal-dependent hydrolase